MEDRNRSVRVGDVMMEEVPQGAMSQEVLAVEKVDEARIELLEGTWLCCSFLTSLLQNYKRINLCCFKSLGLWYVIIGPKENGFMQKTKRVRHPEAKQGRSSKQGQWSACQESLPGQIR